MKGYTKFCSLNVLTGKWKNILYKINHFEVEKLFSLVLSPFTNLISFKEMWSKNGSILHAILV